MAKSSWEYFWELLGEAFSIGLAVVGSVLAGAFCGWLVDEKIFHGKTNHWFMVIGIVLGAIGGFKNLLYFSRKMNRERGRKDEF